MAIENNLILYNKTHYLNSVYVVVIDVVCYINKQHGSAVSCGVWEH